MFEIKKIFKNHQVILSMIIILLIGIITWYKALNGYFLYGLEPYFLLNTKTWTLPYLISNHALIFFLSFKLFGWNATGWILLAVLFHLLACCLGFLLIKTFAKDNLFAFVSSALFTVNIAYVDILSWGTYRALYPLLLSLFITTCLLFYQFRKTKKIMYYWIIIILLIVSLMFREIAIFMPVILLLLDIFFFTNPFKKIMQLLKIHVPFYGIVGLFVLFRHFNGGSPPDYIDERPRLLIGLMTNHQYLEYIFRVVLGFTKKITLQIFPFPILNNVRSSLTFLPTWFVQNYFFSLVGLCLLCLFVYFLIYFRKYKEFKIVLFFFFWMCIGDLFFSIFHPETDATLAQEYIWNQTGYVYFSFFGLCMFISTIIYLWSKKLMQKKKYVIQRIIPSLLIIWLLFQFFTIRNFVSNLNTTVYGPAKNFQLAMKKQFPNSSNIHFYVFPNSAPLGDNLLAWNYFRSSSPEDLQPGYKWSAPYLSVVLDNLQSGRWSVDKLHVLDKNSEDNFIDDTNILKKSVSSVKTFSFESSDNKILDQLDFPIEFPYEIKFAINANSINTELSPMGKFLQDWYEFASRAKITVSSTRKFNNIDTFPNIKSQNLIDFNFGQFSYWEAEDTLNRKATITIDLNTEENVYAIAWSSPTNAIPGKYIYSASNDGKNWTQISTIQDNSRSAPIDIVNAPKSRYIKFEIITTRDGSPPVIDEISVLTNKSEEILKKYVDFKKLSNDGFEFSTHIENLSPIVCSQMHITSKSELREATQIINFLTPLDSQEHTYIIQPTDNEFYSQAGEFLSRKVKRIEVETPEFMHAQIYNLSITIDPRLGLLLK